MTGVARLDEIEARAAEATAEPWTEQGGFVLLGGKHPSGPRTLASYIERDEDAAFIAHARSDVPFLCHELRLALGREATLRTALRELTNAARPYIDGRAGELREKWDAARAVLASLPERETL